MGIEGIASNLEEKEPQAPVLFDKEGNTISPGVAIRKPGNRKAYDVVEFLLGKQKVRIKKSGERKGRGETEITFGELREEFIIASRAENRVDKVLGRVEKVAFA